MTEIEKIKKNTNGELPDVNYDVLHVTGIDNAEEILQNFKKSIITILENKDIAAEEKKWEELLPSKLVNVVTQFNFEDFRNDELVFSLRGIVEDVQDKEVKEWEWYSSKLEKDGFKVYFEGTFRARFTSFVRFQGVPLSKITIERNGVVYPINVLKDVMSYKKVN
ncbi:MAG: hypothetical protein QM687_01230 [Ferruginibacter sp.]